MNIYESAAKVVLKQNILYKIIILYVTFKEPVTSFRLFIILHIFIIPIILILRTTAKKEDIQKISLCRNELIRNRT